MQSRKRKVLKVITYIVIVLAAYIAGAKTGSEIGLKQVAVKQELAKPNMNINELMVWANEAAVVALSFNYVDYERQLQQAQGYFTPDGWKMYVAALKESQQLSQIIKDKMIVSAVATDTPEIMAQGVHEGKYSWKVTIPMLVTYHSATEEKSENLLISMLIVRTEQYIGKRGVGILTFASAVKDSK